MSDAHETGGPDEVPLADYLEQQRGAADEPLPDVEAPAETAAPPEIGTDADEADVIEQGIDVVIDDEDAPSGE